MEWARSKVRSAKQRVAEETGGVSSKRERARIIGRLFAEAAVDQAQTAQEAIVNQAHSAHDRLKEVQHQQRQRRRSDEFSEAAAGTRLSRLYIECLAAADLREENYVQAFATCDAYCIAAVGQHGSAWPAKCKIGTASTAVAPRQRHPRWASVISIPIGQPQELIVRIMDSKTLKSDEFLGEVCIDLAERAAGAASFRVLGSGFASLCLRWSAEAAAESGEHGNAAAGVRLPRGSSAFERALGFWSAHAGDEALAVQALALVLNDCDVETANELVLQAPLTAVLRADVQASGDVLRSLHSALARLQPCAKARLAGVLVERSSKAGPKAPEESEEQLLHDLFSTTSGDALVELKRLIDTNGTRFDLSYLVDNAVTNTARRTSLVSHIQEQAVGIADRPLHLVSDIDMTILSGNFGRGGPKFPSGPIPGSALLLRALGCQVTFLTARPQIWEWQTRRSLLNEVGIVDAAILPGNLRALAQYVVAPEESSRSMGERKGEAFRDFAALHPEARFIFLGDSGEGDVDFAIQFAALRPFSSEDGRHQRVALIHDVAADEIALSPKTGSRRRAELEEQRVLVFDTYAGAALSLFKLDLLSAQQLMQVAQGCHDEFEELDPEKFLSDGAYFARRRELRDDCERVNRALLKADGDFSVEVRSGIEGDIPWWRL